MRDVKVAQVHDELHARALVLEGMAQPSGYTEPILHARRAHRKTTERTSS